MRANDPRCRLYCFFTDNDHDCLLQLTLHLLVDTFRLQEDGEHASHVSGRQTWQSPRTLCDGYFCVIRQNARPHNTAPIALKGNAFKPRQSVKNVSHPVRAPAILNGLRP
jgi:hypothetical protein